jgi:uncharacterized membrane protein
MDHEASTGKRPFDSPEGRIFLSGLVLAVLYVAWLGLSLLFTPEHFHAYVGMTATHILFGRAAGMSFGYALHYGHAIVVPVNVAIETILVLIFYPLFVFSVRRLLVFGALKNVIERMHRAAEMNQDKIRRYGIPGLFVFVFIPFWMTGPLVGSIIGFLLGLKPWVNLTVVLSGTYLACIAWAFILHELHARVAEFSPFAPMILVAIIIAIVIVGQLLERTRNDRNSRSG